MNRMARSISFAVGISFALAAMPGAGAQQPKKAAAQPARMTHAQAIARAKAVVAKMTLDEKIAQLHGIRDAQNYRVVPGVERLGIPALHMTNGPAGVGPGGGGPQKPATAMPAPIALAATWDPELARQYGKLEAEETHSLSSQLFESPDINIARVPQGGRVFESFGEDPYLTSRIAVADIEGIQGANMMANVKHFLANNQEAERLTINTILGERAMREIYLPGFEASIKEAHSGSVMCSYPKLNGPFNCESAPTLINILKKEWGFDGFVLSDWGATHSTVESAMNGLDLEMPTGRYFADDLKQAVQNGKVPMTRIDEMLTLRYAKMMEFGLFGPQPRPTPIPVFEHGAISRDIAQQGMVLLKNEGNLLPLDRQSVKTCTKRAV